MPPHLCKHIGIEHQKRCCFQDGSLSCGNLSPEDIRRVDSWLDQFKHAQLRKPSTCTLMDSISCSPSEQRMLLCLYVCAFVVVKVVPYARHTAGRNSQKSNSSLVTVQEQTVACIDRGVWCDMLFFKRLCLIGPLPLLHLRQAPRNTHSVLLCSARNARPNELS